MTREAVQRAVSRAIEQAYLAGVSRRPMSACVLYADSLVMPMVDLALAEATEQGAIALRQAQLDPEPLGDPPAIP